MGSRVAQCQWIESAFPWTPLLAVCLTLWVLGVGNASFAIDEEKRMPFDLTAVEVEYDRGRELYIASGDVVIVQLEPKRTLTADWITFSNRTQQGIASGNVVLVDGLDTLNADFLQFHVSESQGIVFDGRLSSGERGYRMEGAEVRQTASEQYEFKKGVFTTCRCPDEGREPWRIRAESADIEVGGYAVARNTTFDVLGVPVAWMPWMIYPLKTERTTGFLFPELNASSRGTGDIGIPFFWAARENINVTFTPAIVSGRGFKPKLLVDYVFGEESDGSLFASFLDDHRTDPPDPSTPFDKERWAFDLNHDQFLPWDMRLQADIQLVSDNQWPFDFRRFSEHRPDRYLDSVAFLTKHFEGESGAYAVVPSVRLTDDLQSPDDLDRDRFMLQRWPEVEFTGLAKPVARSPFVGSFDVEYSFFQGFRKADDRFEGAIDVDKIFLDTGIDARPDGTERDAGGRFVVGDGSLDNAALGGPEGDGRFQEGEPLVDNGNRLILNPRVALPLQVGEILELQPELGVHQTFYESDERSFESRTLFTGRIDAQARMRRTFDLPFGMGKGVHILEPQFGYAIVSHSFQRKNPMFVPRTATPQKRIRQFDLDNVTRDVADRIESYHGFTVGFANRLYGEGFLESIVPDWLPDVRPIRLDDEEEDGKKEELEEELGVRRDTTRLLVEGTLSASYQLSPSQPGSIYFEGRAYPGGGLFTRTIFGYDLDQAVFAEGLAQFGYSSPFGHDFVISHRYLREIPRFFESFRFNRERFDQFEEGFDRVNQASLFARLPLSRNWAVSYSGAYSFEQAISLGNQGAVEYISSCRCWAAQLRVTEDRVRGPRIDLQYTLVGLGNDAIRPFSGGLSQSVRLNQFFDERDGN